MRRNVLRRTTRVSILLPIVRRRSAASRVKANVVTTIRHVRKTTCAINIVRRWKVRVMEIVHEGISRRVKAIAVQGILRIRRAAVVTMRGTLMASAVLRDLPMEIIISGASNHSAMAIVVR